MDLAFEFARHVAAVGYDDIPPEVAEVTKRDILDLIGVALAGSTRGPGCGELAELVREGGGREESTILGFGYRVSAWMAAFVNGGFAHALDYDTYRQEPGAHAAISTVPAALAIAERVGNVSGKQFIAAVALGNDIIYRLGLAVVEGWKTRLDWLTSSVYGPWGAAAASAKLLGLSEERIADAFGIVFPQVAGTQEMAYSPGSVIKALYASFAAKAGVLSALMASRGITGTKSSMEGRAGFLNVYFRGEYDREILTGQLGKKFEGQYVTFKRWPCCAGSHPLVDASLRVARKHDFAPGDVEEIVAFITSDFQLALCQPLEARQRPRTGVDAGFSIPFLVATAIGKKRVAVGDFTPAALDDSVTLDLARKVVPKFYPDAEALRVKAPGAAGAGGSSGNLYSKGKVEVKLKGGIRYSEEVDFTPGHPDTVVGMEELSEKFRDCASYAANPLPKDKVDRAIELISHLEGVDDVAEVVRLVS